MFFKATAFNFTARTDSALGLCAFVHVAIICSCCPGHLYAELLQLQYLSSKLPNCYKIECCLAVFRLGAIRTGEILTENIADRHRTLNLVVPLRLYARFDMSVSDQGVMSDLLLVLDVDSRLDVLLGASLVDLLGTHILCRTPKLFLKVLRGYCQMARKKTTVYAIKRYSKSLCLKRQPRTRMQALCKHDQKQQIYR